MWKPCLKRVRERLTCGLRLSWNECFYDMCPSNPEPPAIFKNTMAVQCVIMWPQKDPWNYGCHHFVLPAVLKYVHVLLSSNIMYHFAATPYFQMNWKHMWLSLKSINHLQRLRGGILAHPVLPHKLRVGWFESGKVDEHDLSGILLQLTCHPLLCNSNIMVFSFTLSLIFSNSDSLLSLRHPSIFKLKIVILNLYGQASITNS